MALKMVVDTLEGLPEEVKKEYVEKEDGKFHLDVEGAVNKKKLEEFRDTNIQLMKEAEELKKKLDSYKGVDVKKYNEALKKLQGLDDKTLIEEGKIKELLDLQTDRMKKDYESQIEALSKGKTELNDSVESLRVKLAQITIDNAIQMAVAALEAKALKGTAEDIIARGRRVFTMDYEKNTPVARNDKGNPLFGKDGVTPLTIKEWVEDLPVSAPHFFEGSGGSGGLGGGSSASERSLGISKEDFAKLPPGERLKRLHSKANKAA